MSTGFGSDRTGGYEDMDPGKRSLLLRDLAARHTPVASHGSHMNPMQRPATANACMQRGLPEQKTRAGGWASLRRYPPEKGGLSVKWLRKGYICIRTS